MPHRAKSRKSGSAQRPITPEQKEWLDDVVTKAAALGHPPPAAVQLHRVIMDLAFATGGSCFMSVENLAKRAGLSSSGVNQARAKLKKLGSTWTASL